jgi:hypothetical protein
MQLITSSKHKAGPVRLALAAASASLLIGNHAQAEENPWLVDIGVLSYKEGDGRVSATEPIVSLKKDLGDEHIIAMKFTYDALTGASPTGAVPSKQTVTYTGASGRSSTTTTIGKLPLSSFEDKRTAFNLGWEQPLGDRFHISLGGNYSSENDFSSNGFNAALSSDFNDKNTTLSLGVNLESDKVNAIGGIPRALTASQLAYTRADSESKDVHDVLIGISQVINRHWLTQINFSHSASTGYQNDPYKILSVIDVNGNAVKDPYNSSSNFLMYESRPDSRTRQSIFWDNKIHLTEDVIDIALRHYSDDWGIKSNTLDLRYRLEVGENNYLEPHYRYYTQSQADFYKPYLVTGADVINGAVNLEYASSDPRLAKLNGTTFGIKWGYEISRNSEFNIRVEQYKQNGDSPAQAQNMAALRGLNLYPGLSAQTIMIGYSFEL